MVVDISERKRTEEALQNSEALYQSLVETLPVCIFRKDLDGRFIFGNRTFCERLKKPLSDIIGKTDPDFYPREMGSSASLVNPQAEENVVAAWAAAFLSVGVQHSRPQ